MTRLLFEGPVPSDALVNRRGVAVESCEKAYHKRFLVVKLVNDTLRNIFSLSVQYYSVTKKIGVIKI